MKALNLFNLSKVVLSDFFKRKNVEHNLDQTLNKAIAWLCKAQDSTNDGGVSEGYHLYHGWLPSYPETTGYIIETFFDYAAMTGDKSLRERAVKMADWLVAIQNEDGSIPDSYFKKKMVFDTGQVIFGFVRTYEETKKAQYIEAADRAGDWLCQVQEKDGTWRKFAVGGIPHTYYTRVAWSLAELHNITNNDKYLKACIKNIQWAISQQEENGWFNSAAFNLKNNPHPFTHTIAYTIRGILETGIYLQNADFIESAVKAMDNLIEKIPDNGMVSGSYDRYWQGDNTFTCLTGNSQLSIILFKFYIKTQNDKYIDAGKKINRFLMTRQQSRIKNPNLYGAVAGSYPVWGKYIHFAYPNWAAKFFVDALLLEKQMFKV